MEDAKGLVGTVQLQLPLLLLEQVQPQLLQTLL